MNDAGSQPKKRSWVKIGCLGVVGVVGGLTVLGLVVQTLDPEGTERRAAEREAAQAQASAAEAEQAKIARQAELDSALAVTSRQLAAAYEANEVAAQQQFGKRKLLVSGTVTGVSLDFADNPVIQLDAVNQFLPVQARLDDKDAAGQLSKGQTIKLLCGKVSEVISAPQLSDCALVE